MPRRGSPYGPEYQAVRRRLRGLPCTLRLVCEGAAADSADHFPPLSRHRHLPGSGCCVLRPACLACQHEQGAVVGRGKRRVRKTIAPTPSRDW